MRAFAYLVLLAVLFVPGSAFSQPYPPLCVVPCGMTLVGTTAGVVDPLGEFTIVVNDVTGAPIPMVPVIITMGACVPDINICSVQMFPGVSVSCTAPPGGVATVTNAAGEATFRVMGGAENTGTGGAAAGFGCATVYAGLPPVLIGAMNVAAFDQNSAGGVGPVDISLWLSDVFSPPYEGRSDYNCSSTVNPVDLAMLLGASFAGGSATSCAAYCF